MSNNLKKEDIRIKKTYKAIINTMITMLSHKNFNQITVNDLCEEAFISRATFYVHFNDKYDLLKYWLTDQRNIIIENIHKYESLPITINQFTDKHQKIISNILKHINDETLGLVENFISSIVDAFIEKKINNTEDPKYIILSRFCTGGIVNLISAQIKKEFPPNLNLMDSYLYELLKHMIEWDEE